MIEVSCGGKLQNISDLAALESISNFKTEIENSGLIITNSDILSLGI